MSTISGIANAALSALTTYTAAISVTNTNIANSETTGYTRQQAVIGTTGSTVDVIKVKRIYDSFLTHQLSFANTDLGKWEAEQETISSVENVFSDKDSSGLNAAMSDFWNAWSDVACDPSDSTARTLLASATDTLANTFNSMSSDLTDIQNNIDDSVEETVASINDLTQQIADINQKISAATAAGVDTNTYKDTLDSLALSLSELVDINTSADSVTGQVSIQLADGKTLVEGTTTWSLSTEINSTTGLQDVTWLSESGTETVITSDITSGKLGGYLEVRDEIIPSYQEQLDSLASSIITQVNNLQTNGYDLNGDAGVSLFTGTSAKDIAVNSAITDDPSLIAASSTSDGVPDDGSTATAVAELQNSMLLNSGTATFSDYYASLVSKVGTTVDSIDTYYSAQSDTVELYQNRRDSASGVSIDEETTKLLLYQSAYAASAKVMTYLDEMLKTLIDM
ncbi:MAG: flagellar hook-associated protein FlgK [Smithellaceae bacterium]